MKQFKFWLFATILSFSGFTMLTSCSKEDNPVPSPEPLVLTGEAAAEWTKAHLDSLVKVYLADCGNLLDPDNTRDLLKCIGYTRLNVLDYRAASHIIDSAVFYRLMDRAIEANNKTIVFTMGMYGCGKTASLKNNPDLKKISDEAGLIYEGAYNDIAFFNRKVAQSGEKGFKPIVLYVYNDAETGYTNCMERLIYSNRAVTCEAYISIFPSFEGRVEYLEEHYPDMDLYCMDNSHNSGGKRVSHEEVKKWDYSMSEELQQKLREIMQSYIDSGKLTPEQISALQPKGN